MISKVQEQPFEATDDTLLVSRHSGRIERKKIYARLGFKPGLTEISRKQKKEFEYYIDEGSALLELRGVGGRFLIQRKTKRAVTLANNAVFRSALVSNLLRSSSEALLMGATAGTRIIQEIKSSSQSHLTRAVVFDAVASETVDGCLKWIRDYFARQLSRENKRVLIKRISCGYGDFNLKEQKLIFRLLKLKTLGVAITKHSILVPEKTVTALSGIG